MTRRGMTLIEVLVTISLVGMMGSIAYPSLRVVYQGIDRNEKYAVQFEVARDILDDMTDQLRAVTALPGADSPVLVGVDAEDGGRAIDTLRFTTSDRTQLNRGATVTVEYFIQDPEPNAVETPRLVKRVTDASGATQDEIIYDQVASLNCEYRANDAWVAAWDGPGTPEAVRLTVGVMREIGVRPKQLYTAVRLRAGGA